MNPWRKTPIIGLSPMDGITDASFRFMVDKYSNPSLLMTEFVSVEGINHGATKILQALIFHDSKTPTIAQIYGTDIQSFYNVALVISALGFDGIDINMGCPDHKISGRGAGAGLITTPELAQNIIRTVKTAAKDYFEGKNLEETTLPKKVLAWVRAHAKKKKRSLLPVSVKTRIGFDVPSIEPWVTALLEGEPTAITIHGRTLKQMYAGKPDWTQIARAKELARNTSTKVLGNGNVMSYHEALEKINAYGLDGVLIGRASLGNPWIFGNHIPTALDRIRAALTHCEAFQNLTPEKYFPSLRKHMIWYCKDFRNSASVRDRLMHISTLEEAKEILEPVIEAIELGLEAKPSAQGYR